MVLTIEKKHYNMLSVPTYTFKQPAHHVGKSRAIIGQRDENETVEKYQTLLWPRHHRQAEICSRSTFYRASFLHLRGEQAHHLATSCRQTIVQRGL
jgi:hypothetical protein